jgi:hypothetical protein
MNALVPPSRRRPPHRDADPASDPSLVAVAAEGWMGLPVPLAFERWLNRLEAPEDPAAER